MPELSHSSEWLHTPVVSEAVSSPRLSRLRGLYARLDEIAAADEAYSDDDLNEVCDEIGAISESIIAAPSSGRVGLAEHAMAVQYWFRRRGSCYEEGDPSCKAVCALVSAVFAFTEGGADA